MGQKDGYVEEYYSSGNLREKGFLKNGVEVGVWKHYYDIDATESDDNRDEPLSSGSLARKGTYKDGLEEGRWVKFPMIYWPGEFKKIEHYSAGKLNGPYEIYDVMTDKLVEKGYYDEGKLLGFHWKYEYHSSGEISQKSSYNRDHELEGWMYRYYENGSIQSSVSHLKGKPHGKFQEFHRNGRLKQESWYENGYVGDNYNLYSEKGVLLRERRFTSFILEDPYWDWLVNSFGKGVCGFCNERYEDDTVKSNEVYFNDGEFACHCTEWPREGDYSARRGYYKSCENDEGVFEDKKHGAWDYYLKGEIVKKENYKCGELISEENF